MAMQLETVEDRMIRVDSYDLGKVDPAIKTRDNELKERSNNRIKKMIKELESYQSVFGKE